MNKRLCDKRLIKLFTQRHPSNVTLIQSKQWHMEGEEAAYLALGGLLGTSGSNSTGKPKKPLNLSNVTWATWRTLVGDPMSIAQRCFLPLLKAATNDFLKRVTRIAKMAWEEEKGEEEEEVVGEEEAKWRTWVIGGNEKGLYLEYKKPKALQIYDFCDLRKLDLAIWRMGFGVGVGLKGKLCWENVGRENH